MRNQLICITSKDGELCLREQNPFSYNSEVEYDREMNQWNPHDDWNEKHPPYPIHNLAIQPGETIDADKVVLVWQYRHTPTSNWLTSTLKDDFPNISFEQYQEDNEVVSGFETRQAYTALSPKEPQQNDIDVTLLEGGEEPEEIKVKLDGGVCAHILDTEIVFSNWNVAYSVSSLSFDELKKIWKAFSQSGVNR